MAGFLLRAGQDDELSKVRDEEFADMGWVMRC